MRLASALCDPVRGLVDTGDHLVLALQFRELRCDHAENDGLVLG